MNLWKNPNLRYLIIVLFLHFIPMLSWAQEEEEDLLALLGEEETTDYTIATFKANRIINLHSIENTSRGVLDFKISHRFGFINGGISELFGLDQASIRIGADYGITDRLMVGFGRSSFEKTYDGFAKVKILRQSSGAKTMPFTVSLFGSMVAKTVEFRDPDRENYFSSRLYYSFQGLIGRKLNESISLQLSPTLVHRNLVRTNSESNDVLSLGIGGRFKLNKRISLNAEYIYVFPDQLAPGYRNSMSVGFDIETGGHVFQLHFTNSTSMIEKGYITETIGNWFDGDIHFGFNVSRVFTIKSKDKSLLNLEQEDHAMMVDQVNHPSTNKPNQTHIESTIEEKSLPQTVVIDSEQEPSSKQGISQKSKLQQNRQATLDRLNRMSTQLDKLKKENRIHPSHYAKKMAYIQSVRDKIKKEIQE